MRRFLTLLILLIPCSVLAGAGVVDSSLGLLSFTSKLMLATCASIGVGLLFGAFLKYKHYKENPGQTPLSSPFFLLVFALLFLLLSAMIAYDNKVGESPGRPDNPTEVI